MLNTLNRSAPDMQRGAWINMMIANRKCGRVVVIGRTNADY